jgi:hypothetical protein
MAESLHPAASHHLPAFIAAPGETDTLMVVMSIVLVLGILAFGILFFRLHTLPERIAHKSHKIQFEIVAILGLIALFTHMHIFWIAALLLAFIDLPDFGTSLGRIAGSVERIAGVKPGEGAIEIPPESVAEIRQANGAAQVPPETNVATRQGDGADASPTKPQIAAADQKELSHA